MLTRRSICHCPTCEEITPHSRRRLSLAWAFACFVLVGSFWFDTIATVLLGVAAIVAVRADLRLGWRIECERCRSNLRQAQSAERRRTRPDPRYSTIDLFS
jgi:hypothetical protein